MLAMAHAAFLTTVIGGIISILAIAIHLKYAPPLWVHLMIWLPLTVFSVIYGLRISKAMLITAEHRLKGKEAGRNSLVKQPVMGQGQRDTQNSPAANNDGSEIAENNAKAPVAGDVLDQ